MIQVFTTVFRGGESPSPSFSLLALRVQLSCCPSLDFIHHFVDRLNFFDLAQHCEIMEGFPVVIKFLDPIQREIHPFHQLCRIRVRTFETMQFSLGKLYQLVVLRRAHVVYKLVAKNLDDLAISR